MKKALVILLAVMLLAVSVPALALDARDAVLFDSIEETPAPESADAAETEEAAEETAAAPVLETVTERVIKITYDSFDFDAAVAQVNVNLLAAGACTAISGTLPNGDVYLGRNLDFYCTDAPAYVVEINPSETVKNHVVGIGSSPSLPDWQEDYTLPEAVLSRMPKLCCDGTNGDIYVETNVRSYEWDENGVNYIVTNHTNEGAPRMSVQNLIMWACINYNSIDEVLEHMNDVDWFTFPDGYNINGAGMNFSTSYFIVEKTGKSGIIEFCGDSWAYTPTFFNANYYQNPEYYALEKMPVGEARIDALMPKWARVAVYGTEESVREMMNTVSYAQIYRTENNFDVTSEYFGCSWTTSRGFEVTADMMTKEWTEQHPEMTQLLISDSQRQSENRTWEESIAHHDWETSLCNVVNMTKGTIDVVASEHYGVHFAIDIATGDITF